MEFHLIYQGGLRSERGSDIGPVGRAGDKHKLRKFFHPQLRELWDMHPDLRSQGNTYWRYVPDPRHRGKRFEPVDNSQASEENVKKYIDHIADDHQCCNGRFVPLVSELGGFTCALDILFLRRDNPGSMLQSGGDIDNRIKVLLDGLRMPKILAELGGMSLDPNFENPFFCLLEDDSLITKISITTDRLLLPRQESESIHDVLLDIHVTVVNPSAIFAGNRLV